MAVLAPRGSIPTVRVEAENITAKTVPKCFRLFIIREISSLRFSCYTLVMATFHNAMGSV